MSTKITGTVAIDCGTVLDAPNGADLEMTNTKAVRVQTVYKIRDADFKEKILSYVESGTPVEVIDDFINSINALDVKDVASVELVTYRTKLNQFLKSDFANALTFATSIIGFILSLPGVAK
ncbi:hypothetical protein QSG85_12610 [Acinetobacter baumannii]|uniref:hypothetical protein n=1 Tax=Acinetobacter baumannii TaxID=470 RepID=UPI002934C0DF|nr:hypothetical protein [Acinetobacter baumannii]WOE34162.1 hypothetical protein QSG85_12610 [Acinetobacter baumannii]